MRLLRSQGNWMNQSAIVEETGWSKAKVSRLLTRMEDRGLVEKRKDGRRNVIVLRDER